MCSPDGLRVREHESGCTTGGDYATSRRSTSARRAGASCSRGYDGRRVALEELSRFPNRPIEVRGHQFWNVPGLWKDVLAGLEKAREQTGSIASVGVDTWGVDYGLVDSHGLLVGLPYHYRDHRTDGVMEQVFTSLPRTAIYSRTGIQFLPFNTLYQLAAQRDLQPGLLVAADRLLLMPDLFHSWLCGERVSERTNATTTRLWDTSASQWATDLLDPLDLPKRILPPVVEPGTLLGWVLPELRATLGDCQVALPATHDTGSAVAPCPSRSQARGGATSAPAPGH